MFHVTIAFRCNDKNLTDKKGLEFLAKCIIYNMTNNWTKYYKKIERMVRPMGQLEAGFHLNLDEHGTDLDILSNIFEVSKEMEEAKCVRVRIIAKNFWKFDFICNEALPFRVNAEKVQALPTALLAAFRLGFALKP